MERTLKNGFLVIQSASSRLLGLIPAIFIMLFAYYTTFITLLTGSCYNFLFGEIHPKQPGYILFMALFAVLMLAVIPLLVNKYVLRSSAHEMGLQIPKNKISAILLTLAALAVSIPAFLNLIQQPSIKQFYTFGPCNIYFFISFQIFVFPVYYFAEELFFRGFVFLNLWKRIGWHSYWFGEFLFAIAHLGKPPLEIIISIPVGVLLNYITLRSRSVLPAFIVHTLIGMLIFTLINIRSVVW